MFTMHTLPIKKPRRRLIKTYKKLQHLRHLPPVLLLPTDIIAEIFSSLDVKTLLKLKCVCKSWKSLISNPTFIQKHLNKSSQNPHLTVMWDTPLEFGDGLTLFPFPYHTLIQKPIITVRNKNLHYLLDRYHIAGSCNGLICVFSAHLRLEEVKQYQYYSIYFLNPSTGKRSEQLGYFDHRVSRHHFSGKFKFAFGYDDLSKTYKVVAYFVNPKSKNPEKPKSVVRILNVDGGYDSEWRDIQCFPVIPFDWQIDRDDSHCQNNGVHVNGTINWLSVRNSLYYSTSHVDGIVILSLDLSTETYKQLMLPKGFDEVPEVEPTLKAFMGSLCFGHDSKKTDFVLWQMKEYGVEESWTQLLKISYMDLQIDYLDHPVFLYRRGDIVIFGTKVFGYHTIVYNLRNKRKKDIRISNDEQWFFHGEDYVESLVSF